MKTFIRNLLALILIFPFLLSQFCFSESVTETSMQIEPIPFQDSDLVFVSLEFIQSDLASQVQLDFSALKTKDKQIYTFKTGLMTQLNLPMSWQDGQFGFKVNSNFSGPLCDIISYDKKGLYQTQLFLEKQGDGSYKVQMSPNHQTLSNLPLQYNLILVSRAVPIDSNLKFSLVQLKDLKVARTKDMSVNTEIGPSLQAMFAASSKVNSFELNVVSGYRSVTKQKNLFNTKMAALKKQGVANPFETTAKTINPPTQSEHHTGYAVDILSNRNTALGTFKGSSEAKWLEANAYKYGFVVRYPEGKTKITGISYEPWHFRYLGKNFAKLLKENKMTLEEWVNEGKKGTLYTSADGKSHYFIVLPSKLKTQVSPALQEKTQTQLFYISPGWVAYDVTL